MPRTPTPRSRRTPPPDKPVMGRPPTPPEERRNKSFHVLVTEKEYEELHDFAKTAGLPAGTWARLTLLAAARGGA